MYKVLKIGFKEIISILVEKNVFKWAANRDLNITVSSSHKSLSLALAILTALTVGEVVRLFKSRKVCHSIPVSSFEPVGVIFVNLMGCVIPHLST